ncbi:MAG: dihydroneopterin aldolase [Chloroflexi bacterium]|nr:dihydroneopterin aldolase [Chloroflexota bacterium]
MNERDCIYIEDLLVRTIIGINDWERRERQDVLISLCLYTDTRPAGQSDDIRDALNYRDVAKRIIHLVENAHFLLVERLAEEIARVCVQEFHVPRVQVRVEKPGAIRFAKTVGVRIERRAEDFSEVENA